MWRSRSKYRENVSAGLDFSYGQAPVEETPLSDLRLIVFSDLHRGIGDRADDFRLCRKIYHAALGYYDSLKFRLFLLGDIEELWERLLLRVVHHYESTLEQERAFFEQDRAVRFLGNHDDTLEWPWNRKILDRFTRGAPLHDGLLIRVLDDSDSKKSLGEMLFVHGHQGIRYTWLDRFVVKRFWAPIQRLTGFSAGVPSSDHGIRLTHERSLYDWAARKDDLLLVCGHTHHPVFMSAAWEQTIREELEQLRAEEALAETIALKEAELRWVVTDLEEKRSSLPKKARPCYFNTGCCSFNDGSITGIEIADGHIRLVRWSGASGAPSRQVLRDASLTSVLGKCDGGNCEVDSE